MGEVKDGRGQDHRDEDSENPGQGERYRTCSATGNVSMCRSGSRFTA
jgi:hypothetical protein